MSFSDHTTQFEQSFRRTAELLRELLQGLKARRAAWGSARPRVVVPSPELEQLAQRLAGEETLRADLLAQIRRVLPSPIGAPASELHVNVTRIAAALPPAAAKALQDAAGEATSLAKAVRVEVTMGQRLLRFTQNAHAHLLEGLGKDRGATLGAAVYDRHARSGRSLEGNQRQGMLVDGRI